MWANETCAIAGPERLWLAFGILMLNHPAGILGG
jgi:hypothetical protein